ncbi:hypothetical protein QTP70_033088, partial [Hemibagrus guttatus]
FLDFILPTEAVETILNFCLWCNQRCQDLVHCPISTVPEFLQTCLFEGLSPSTLRTFKWSWRGFSKPPLSQ